MARYSLKLPLNLKKEAENWAEKQKVSLNQFIVWAVAEKVGTLKQSLDAPNFPKITYRRGAAGIPSPLIQGTGLRVQTIVTAAEKWGMDVDQIAGEYDLDLESITIDIDSSMVNMEGHQEGTAKGYNPKKPGNHGTCHLTEHMEERQKVCCIAGVER